MPFIAFFIIVFHLIYLHNYGSTNKLLLNFGLRKISFYPNFWLKDLINFILLFFWLIFLFFFPFLIGDSLIFEEVNSLVSPVHIVPE